MASHAAIDAFVASYRQIEDLLQIDSIILDIPIRLLEGVQEAQDKLKPPLQNPKARVDKPLQLLRKVRDNASVASRLQILRNQCLVLAVSHFTSAVRAVFIDQLSTALRDGAHRNLLAETLSLSVGEILELAADPAPRLAEAVIQRKDISFQDMKSISRAFQDFLGKKVEKSQEVNDIIAAQACRHAIVHNGGVVDDKLLRQVQNATPRRLQQILTKDKELAISDQDLSTVGASMVKYLHSHLS